MQINKKPATKMKNWIFILLGFFLQINSLPAQQPYFVDGYHGGIYGHYPEWVTGFMVDKLEKYPEWKLGIEIEPETWDTVRLNDREAYERFKNISTSNRIEFTNPSYAQPYCYNISGESIIRQFAYGIKKIHQHFPEVTFTTYAVEEPCFTSSLPQILKQFGFRYAVLKCPNTCWGGYTSAYGGELVNWIGPDGTSILSVPRYASEAFEHNSTWQTTAWNNSEAYLQASYAQGISNPVGMSYQDAGWDNGPWLGTGAEIKNKSIYTTWKQYIEEISAKQTDDNWHFSQENVLVNLMWGSQVLQRIAQQVRASENNIIQTEKISAMAAIEHHFQPDEPQVDEAWRQLMMAQHHDSWIVPYNQLNEDQTWAQAIASWTNGSDSITHTVLNEAINTYRADGAFASSNLGAIRVYNTLGVGRSGLVAVKLPTAIENQQMVLYNTNQQPLASKLQKRPDGQYLLFEAEVPSFGYATYEIRRGANPTATQTGVQFDAQGNCLIENDMYKITLDKSKGGTIKSLIAKHADSKEFVDLNQSYNLGEIAGHFFADNQFYSSKDSPAVITVLEDHAFLIKVLLEGTIANHPFKQIITLEKGQKRIDFDLTIDWQDPQHIGIGQYDQKHDWKANKRAYTDDRYKLKIMFPTSLGQSKLYKNAPFDVNESQLENTFFGSWDSIKHNVILNWVDIKQVDDAYGLALLSDHTTSYLYGNDYPLSLTAQYAGVGLWGMNYKITQPTQLRYALIPHKDKWDQADISNQSVSWNEPLLPFYDTGFALLDKALIDVDQSGYEISSVQVQNEDLLVRLFNAKGDHEDQIIRFDFDISSVQEVLLNGQPVQQIAVIKDAGQSAVRVNMPRYGLKTLRIKKQDRKI